MQSFKDYSRGDKIFTAIVFVILTLFFIAVLYPCIFVISASFSSGTAVQSGRVVLWPVDISFEGYKTVFNTPTIWIGYRNSILYTIGGTLINLFMTLTAAYCLSRHDLPGRNGIMLLFTFTMFFSGGLIPLYMQVQSLHLLNNPLALMLPGAISVYNMIVARTFIVNTIPRELLEASQIDGCSDIKYFISIVLPLSKAIIAVLTLFYAVGHWNAYFNAMIYLQDLKYYPLQLVLRQILLTGSALEKTASTVAESAENESSLELLGTLTKYCVIVVSTLPVIAVYPFLQKYFIKGVMIGAVKG